MKKMTLALIAVATVGLASPAFAQAFNPTYGTGNVQPFAYQPTTTQQSARSHVRALRAARRDALGAYASEPAPQASYAPRMNFNSVNPGATGGGSAGYNAHLYDAE